MGQGLPPNAAANASRDGASPCPTGSPFVARPARYGLPSSSARIIWLPCMRLARAVLHSAWALQWLTLCFGAYHADGILILRSETSRIWSGRHDAGSTSSALLRRKP